MVVVKGGGGVGWSLQLIAWGLSIVERRIQERNVVCCAKVYGCLVVGPSGVERNMPSSRRYTELKYDS